MPNRDVSLLILDVINPFDFPAAGKLRARALRMAPRLARLKRRVKAAGGSCVYVNDNFGLWQSNFRELLARVQETPGAELAERLAPEEDDRFVLKPRNSGFFQTPLELLLQHLGAKRVIVTGIAAESCVLATALDAHIRELDCHVPGDCTESVSEARKRAALQVLAAARIGTGASAGLAA